MPDTARPSPPDPAALLAEVLARVASAVPVGVLREGLNATEAAAFVGVSPATWRATDSRGICPAPAELGDRCPRWGGMELRAWLLAKAPTRVQWVQVRDAMTRRAG